MLTNCPDCGRTVSTIANSCPGCGRPFKKRTTTAALAIFLGGIGAHRLYLGQVGWAVVYMALCWTFIPAILGVLEGFRLLGMSDRQFAATYGRRAPSGHPYQGRLLNDRLA